jgi:hypothetical protein
MATTETVNGRISLDILFNEILLGTPEDKGMFARKFSALVDLATGTADNQINVGYAATVTGIGATTTSYDLIGVLTNLVGTVINFDEVVLIAIKNLGTTATQYLTIGPHPTNGFGKLAANVGFWSSDVGVPSTGPPAIGGGGSVVAADGYSWTVMHCKGGVPATAGATDILAVVTTGTSNTWQIMILGRDN